MAYDKEAYEKHKHKVLERQRKRRKERKRWFKEEIVAKSACIRCGESHIACLDFHHKDPSEKEFGLGFMLSLNKNKEQILAEIAKCEVLCSNCHRKLHWEENMDH
jgi:hypothetical protein